MIPSDVRVRGKMLGVGEENLRFELKVTMSYTKDGFELRTGAFSGLRVPNYATGTACCLWAMCWTTVH